MIRSCYHNFETASLFALCHLAPKNFPALFSTDTATDVECHVIVNENASVVTGVCQTSKMYSSAGQYSCRWFEGSAVSMEAYASTLAKWFDVLTPCETIVIILLMLPQWGAADAEIKVPYGENTELKRSPFKALSR